MEEDINMTNEYLRKNLIASEEEKEKAIKLYNDKKRMKDCLINLNAELGVAKRIVADLEEKEKIEKQIHAIVLLEVENEYIKERYKELKEITNQYNAFGNDYIPNDMKMIIADREYFNNGIFKENFTPKSLIKEKIEELKQQYKDYEKRWEEAGMEKAHPFYKYLIRIEAEIDILEELLGEEK